MKNLLANIEARFKADESFQRLLLNYSRAMKTEDWQFFLYAIESVKMEMHGDLLSSRFTKLDAVEKDVQQRAYYNIRQVLDFLSDPKTWIVKKEAKRKKFLDFNKFIKRPDSKQQAS